MLKLNALKGLLFPDLEPPNTMQPIHQARILQHGMADDSYSDELLRLFFQYILLNIHHLAVDNLIFNFSLSVVQQIKTKELVK